MFLYPSSQRGSNFVCNHVNLYICTYNVYIYVFICFCIPALEGAVMLCVIGHTRIDGKCHWKQIKPTSCSPKLTIIYPYNIPNYLHLFSFIFLDAIAYRVPTPGPGALAGRWSVRPSHFQNGREKKISS